MRRPRQQADDDAAALGAVGGDWRGLRPTFDNPFTWSLPLMRIAGVTVRIHIIFLLYIVIQLLRSVHPARDVQSPLNESLTAIWMASLVLAVLAHELGHCLACRLTGGTVDEVLMWPLGGLAWCQPAAHWKAHLLTAVGGPLVNVAVCLVAGVTLGLLTGRWWGLAAPNPLDPFGGMAWPELKSLAHQVLLLVHVTSLLLLLFNLLPILPLDGGRILQALLWSRCGYHRSMVLTVRAGLVGAILLGVFGAVGGHWAVVGVALLGLATCHLSQRQLQWTDSLLGLESPSMKPGWVEPELGRGRRSVGSAERSSAAEAAPPVTPEVQDVDLILKKIAHSGMASLTEAERARLRLETERKRQGL